MEFLIPLRWASLDRNGQLGASGPGTAGWSKRLLLEGICVQAPAWWGGASQLLGKVQGVGGAARGQRAMSTPAPQLPPLKSLPQHLPSGLGECQAQSQAPCSLTNVTSDASSSALWEQEWASCRMLGV